MITSFVGSQGLVSSASGPPWIQFYVCFSTHVVMSLSERFAYHHGTLAGEDSIIDMFCTNALVSFFCPYHRSRGSLPGHPLGGLLLGGVPGSYGVVCWTGHLL